MFTSQEENTMFTIPAKFMCRGTKRPLEDPHILTCGHWISASYINNFKNMNMGMGVRSEFWVYCPECGNKVHHTKVVPDPKKKKELIELLIFCSECKCKCTLADMKNHELNDCMERKIKCQYCLTEMIFHEFYHHHCVKKPIECDVCSKWIVGHEYDAHLVQHHTKKTATVSVEEEEEEKKTDKEEEMELVRCCWQCGTMLPKRTRILNHLLFDCLEARDNCPFGVCCSFVGTKPEMVQHLECVPHKGQIPNLLHELANRLLNRKSNRVMNEESTFTRTQYKDLFSELDVVTRMNDAKRSNDEKNNPTGAINWTINHVDDKRKRTVEDGFTNLENHVEVSPIIWMKFYGIRYGFRMRVYFNGCGDFWGKGTSIVMMSDTFPENGLGTISGSMVVTLSSNNPANMANTFYSGFHLSRPRSDFIESDFARVGEYQNSGLLPIEPCNIHILTISGYLKQ